MLIYLAEIETIDLSGAAPQSITLRIASSPHGYNHPTGSGYYAPRIKDVTNISRTIVAPRRTFGEADVSTGTLEVANTDGALDEWFTYAYGLPARVLIGEAGSPYYTFTPIISGRIEQPSGDSNTIIFRFQDRSKELERNVSPAIYMGNNSGVVGTEGTPQDIKGENKIRIFGKVKNIAPDPINVNNRIFAVNHDEIGNLSAVQSIDAVRVNGANWSNAGNVASMAILESTSVTQGTFKTCITKGAFKMGGTWQGELTVDSTQTATASNIRIANVAKELLLSAKVLPSDIDLGVIEVIAPWNVGVVIKNDTARAALNEMLGNSAIWFAPNGLGVYQFRQVALVGEQPVATLKSFAYPNVASVNDLQILELEPELSSVGEVAIPAYRVVVNYDKRHVVQNADSLAASLSEATKQYYSREYSKIVVEDLSILSTYPDAPTLEFNTLLCDLADATALANHLFALYSIPHQLYNVTVALNGAANIQLGDVVRLVYFRFGLSQGKLGRVISQEYDPLRAKMSLGVWT